MRHGTGVHSFDLPASRRETVDGTFKKISRWLGSRPGGPALPYAGGIPRCPSKIISDTNPLVEEYAKL